ncbi:ATP-binding protein [Campylobacter sp. MIT 12-5580]|uniref:AAA family ATPase n=1 Tax=Campylobacter sp. MIT 12-5580 TaxID=2040651 RepID=UPI0010F4DB95|nr:ATP-binding protein [Campylobacter sp. MIT 12-5580]TKX29815.1 ATP-binding protein [Campylobacter sp. MIT 12-5580]
MLIEFRVSNYRSIQKEQVLSLIANKNKIFKQNTFETNDFTLLKSVVIYGANAAGKSNIIKAISCVKQIVLTSAQTQRGFSLPITPFLLGDEEGKPSEFELSFIAKSPKTDDNIRYRYGFKANKTQILEEWLFAYPNNRMQKWFQRAFDEKEKKYEYEFGSNFLGEKKLWQNSTRENALFLSTAVQLNSEQLKPVFDWFLSKLQVSDVSGFDNSTGVSVDMIEKHKEQFVEYLKVADLDIESVDIKKEKISIENLPAEIPEQVKKDLEGKIIVDIKTIHLKQNGQKVEFDLEKLESDGTQRFFRFLGPIMHILERGKIFIIDELNTSFHPLMTKLIISLFHDPNINKNNAQLIFTTHETSILSDEIFRKDQIYFCEKENKASKLYSMSDFKGLREGIDFEKSYLLGRFGALPNIKEI